MFSPRWATSTRWVKAEKAGLSLHAVHRAKDLVQEILIVGVRLQRHERWSSTSIISVDSVRKSFSISCISFAHSPTSVESELLRISSGRSWSMDVFLEDSSCLSI